MFPLEVLLQDDKPGSEFSSAMTNRAGGWVVLVQFCLVMWGGDCTVKPPSVVTQSFQSLRWDGSGSQLGGANN